MRDITESANVRLAAVNYHFGAKEKLLEKVLERRGNALNSARRLLLAQGDVLDGAPPSRPEQIRLIIHAYFDPLRVHYESGDRGWRNYGRLISQLAAHRLWIKPYIAPLFNDLGNETIARIMKIAPDIDRDTVLHCFQFMIGTMLYTFSDSPQVDPRADDNVASTPEISMLSRSAEEFCLAGMCRILDIDEPLNVQESCRRQTLARNYL